MVFRLLTKIFMLIKLLMSSGEEGTTNWMTVGPPLCSPIKGADTHIMEKNIHMQHGVTSHIA